MELRKAANRITALFLALCFAFALTACGTDTTEADIPDDPAADGSKTDVEPTPEKSEKQTDGEDASNPDDDTASDGSDTAAPPEDFPKGEKADGENTDEGDTSKNKTDKASDGDSEKTDESEPLPEEPAATEEDEEPEKPYESERVVILPVIDI